MNELSKLKDIKPNIPINEHMVFHLSWIWAIVLFIAIVLTALFFIKKYFYIKKEKKELLKMINSPKQFAYIFTKKAKKFKNKKNEELLKIILTNLEKYKYKPTVRDIDEETKKMIKQYLKI